MRFCVVIFLFTATFFTAQHTVQDLQKIGTDISSAQSPYRYERLIFKYQTLPASLDSLEAKHLYYGRNFLNEKIETTDPEFVKLAQHFRMNDLEKCISLGKELYAKDPTNLDVLLILMYAYEQKKDADAFLHHRKQLQALTDAIRFSGDGKTADTAYLVNNVSDEYTFLNLLNIGKDYIRHSQFLEDGVLDAWQKDTAKVYIKVIYLQLD